MNEFKYFEFKPYGGIYFDKENANIMFQHMDDLEAENAELRKHVRMPDEPLEIDEKDFYIRAFIKWAIEEQPELKRLEAENAKLREELAKWEQLTTGINLPDYPVSQFVPKDLERENAKLRELVRELLTDPDAWDYDYFKYRMRELGIEV